jgi:tetratricopeptide (TPR) repeat protein
MNKNITTLIALVFSLVCLSQNHEEIKRLTAKGNKYYTNNDFEKAEKYFLKILKIDSIHKDSYFNLGAINIKKNNNDKAISYFKKCIELGDLRAIDILDTNLKYNFKELDLDKIEKSEVLNEIGLKLKNKNHKEEAELYFLKSKKNTSSGKQFNLEGRKPINRPMPKFTCSKQGRVIVSITVNRMGKVIKATPGTKGSITTAKCLLNEAKVAALQTNWQPDPNAPENQIGQIIYHFMIY